MDIKYNFSLKKYNTFGINAYAKSFVSIENTTDLKAILAAKKAEKKLILGGGSNMLLVNNFDGLVLHNHLKGIEKIKENDDFVWVKVSGGEVWHDFVMYVIDKNWAGLENLSLIPGSVGASPIQNIGAYGVELEQRFERLEAVHLETLETHIFEHSDCHFAYRNSIFKQQLKGQYFITSVTFRLSQKPTFNIQYGAIQKTLEALNVKELSIKKISDAVCQIRTGKLPDPRKIGNSGSFFKNPELDKNTFAKLQKKYPNIPNYPLENGKIKVPAAWLIEQAGWKGKRFGDAGVYPHHALVLVNYGDASGREIQQLSNNIQASILEKFELKIHPEVNVLI